MGQRRRAEEQAGGDQKDITQDESHESELRRVGALLIGMLQVCLGPAVQQAKTEVRRSRRRKVA
jgi:hypothetical protein